MNYNIKDNASLGIACKQLLSGEIIIYPTDTLYGLGVDATNTSAIEKLNQLKKRGKPYSIIVDSINMLKKYALYEEVQDEVESIFPGPYTAILRKKNSDLSKLVSLNFNTIGIRIPNTSFILDVVKQINRPIITTSVNLNGEVPIQSSSEIKKYGNGINKFIDNSINTKSNGSTIINFTKNPLQVIRYGDGKFNL